MSDVPLTDEGKTILSICQDLLLAIGGDNRIHLDTTTCEGKKYYLAVANLPYVCCGETPEDALKWLLAEAFYVASTQDTHGAEQTATQRLTAAKISLPERTEYEEMLKKVTCCSHDTFARELVRAMPAVKNRPKIEEQVTFVRRCIESTIRDELYSLGPRSTALLDQLAEAVVADTEGT